MSRYATRDWEVCIHGRTFLRGMEERIVSVWTLGFVHQDSSFINENRYCTSWGTEFYVTF